MLPGAAAEPGRWSTARAEYQRGIMDAISDPTIETVVVMKSAQVGWTEIVNNVVGYYIHQDPAAILVIQPTIEMGEEWSKDRLAPMLRDTPELADRLGGPRGRDSSDTLRHKTFPGGQLAIAGANSPASLASRPIRILLCDEVDRYPASAGSEGDPVALGRKRTTTFWNRKVLLGSTPVLANISRIEAAYEESDKRRYWARCPHCGEMQPLEWEHVRWTNDDPSTARYHCIACGAGWDDAQRWAAVREGEWRAGAEFRSAAGFHISELYSPWKRLAQTVAEFLEARKRPEMLKVWKNTALGLTWQERGEAPDWERLIERREPFKMGAVPERALVLTAGVDNQNDRLELSVWAWAPGYESWLIDTRALYGHPGEPGVWDELAALLNKPWPIDGGGSLRIAKVGIDTGGSYTAAVYSQIRRLRDPRIVPLKGVEGWNRASPVTGPTLVDVQESGRKLKRGLRLWTVSVSTFKSDLYRRLWLTRGDGGFPPGWVHLPEALEPEQVRQLVAEELRTIKDRRGYARMEWHKLRPRNEQLDMAVYARAALSVLGSDRYGDRFWSGFARAHERRPAAREPVAPQNAPPTLAAQQPTPRPAGARIVTEGQSPGRRFTGKLAGA